MKKCEHCDDKKTIRTDEEKKRLMNRVNRLQGQLSGIKKMIEDDKYCGDILTQLLAVDKATKSLSNEILKRHLHTCVLEDIKDGDTEVLDELLELFKKYYD